MSTAMEVKMDMSNFSDEVKAKWNYIKTEGVKVNGALEVDVDNLPAWIDKEKFKTAQKTGQHLRPM